MYFRYCLNNITVVLIFTFTWTGQIDESPKQEIKFCSFLESV